MLASSNSDPRLFGSCFIVPLSGCLPRSSPLDRRQSYEMVRGIPYLFGTLQASLEVVETGVCRLLPLYTAPLPCRLAFGFSGWRVAGLWKGGWAKGRVGHAWKEEWGLL